jgi:hypothetical protein
MPKPTFIIDPLKELYVATHRSKLFIEKYHPMGNDGTMEEWREKQGLLHTLNSARLVYVSAARIAWRHSVARGVAFGIALICAFLLGYINALQPL